MQGETASTQSVAVAVVGGGPAGLMAAEVLRQAGLAVHLFDAMPSVGRKFLLAGRGGLNLTHAEDFDAFVSRYAASAPALRGLLTAFGPQVLRSWVHGLGVDTFVGSSQRVFPVDMKAAPLLRAWMHRLRTAEPGAPAVQFHMRHRWVGWEEAPSNIPSVANGDVHTLCFDTPAGTVRLQAKAVVLALGGASWSRLGSDGAWWPRLAAAGVPLSPFQPSNCGFDVATDRGAGWSPFFRERFAGHALKSVSLRFSDEQGHSFERQGEFVVTQSGVEGSLVYAVSAPLREAINHNGFARFHLNLLPSRSAQQVLIQVAHPRGSRSVSSHLKSRLGLDGVKVGLLNELLSKELLHHPELLAQRLQALPITVVAPRPLEEAISTAGGVKWDAVDDFLMLRQQPGVFVAGEMIDWEAPTGGYLMTGCLSTGRQAGQGAAAYLIGRDAAARRSADLGV